MKTGAVVATALLRRSSGKVLVFLANVDGRWALPRQDVENGKLLDVAQELAKSASRRKVVLMPVQQGKPSDGANRFEFCFAAVAGRPHMHPDGGKWHDASNLPTRMAASHKEAVRLGVEAVMRTK